MKASNKVYFTLTINNFPFRNKLNNNLIDAGAWSWEPGAWWCLEPGAWCLASLELGALLAWSLVPC